MIADHRAPLLALLDAYTQGVHSSFLDTSDSSDISEEHCCQQFRTFVSTRSECFERSLAEGHVTGSAWVVDGSGTRVLLTHHRKLNIWVQLGGHADGEADVAQVALREAREESGITDLQLADTSIFDLDIHQIPARASEAAHLHYDVRFVVQTVSSDAFVVGDESHDLAWVPIAELEKVTTEASMLRMQKKWLAHRRAYAT